LCFAAPSLLKRYFSALGIPNKNPIADPNAKLAAATDKNVMMAMEGEQPGSKAIARPKMIVIRVNAANTVLVL
jgi:hypothetical protein